MIPILREQLLTTSHLVFTYTHFPLPFHSFFLFRINHAGRLVFVFVSLFTTTEVIETGGEIFISFVVGIRAIGGMFLRRVRFSLLIRVAGWRWRTG